MKQIIGEIRSSHRTAEQKAAPEIPQPRQLLTEVRDLCKQGRYEEAEVLCQQRLNEAPDSAIAWVASGEVARAQKSWKGAETMFREALARKPELVEGLLGLGETLYESGRPKDALSPLSAAVRLAPTHAPSLNAYGLTLLATGNALMAGWQFRQAAKIAPNDPYIQNNLGISAQHEGKLSLALKCFVRAVQLKPDYAAAHSNAGLAYREMGAPDRALDYARRAVELDPRDATNLINLGVIHQESDRLDEAEDCFRSALEVDPDSARALHGLGGVAFARDDRDTARQYFLDAAEKDPDFPQAVASLGEVELAEGDFGNGWKHYEYRLKTPESGIRFFPFPLWDGSPLPEGTLLVFAEQGIGDLTMFAGPLDDLRPNVGHVILGCPSRAVTLFQRSYPWIEVVALDGVTLPEATARRVTHQIPIASLMQYFRTTADRFPEHKGYLVPDPERIARWRGDETPDRRELRVGISWKGGTLRTGTVYRSIPLARFADILNIEGIRPYSLQHFKVAAEVDAFRQATGIPLLHDGTVVTDLEELSALMASLDVVVTVCSTVAHLAGALGRPCIVLAPTAASWRYLRAGERLPWYPSVRVLRQTRRGVWDDVLERAADLVRKAAAGNRSRRGG